VSRLKKNDSSYKSLNLQIAEPLTEKRSAEREEENLMKGKKSQRELRDEKLGQR
jgi:hypothetical protein